MSIPKVVVDTDVFVDFLTSRSARTGSVKQPLFRRLLADVFCYTTVFNAAELFSLMRTKREERMAEEALGAVKLLGVNARTAKQLGAVLRSRMGRKSDVLVALIGALCREARVPLITGRPHRYRGISGLRLISTRTLERKGAVLSARDIG